MVHRFIRKNIIYITEPYPDYFPLNFHYKKSKPPSAPCVCACRLDCTTHPPTLLCSPDTFIFKICIQSRLIVKRFYYTVIMNVY